jgi:putative transposase
MLEETRWLYNYMLAYRRDAWEERQESVGLYDTIKLIPVLKQERPSLSKVYSQVLQQSLTRLDLAFQSFFRRAKENAEEAGFPRFKGYGRMTA